MGLRGGVFRKSTCESYIAQKKKRLGEGGEINNKIKTARARFSIINQQRLLLVWLKRT